MSLRWLPVFAVLAACGGSSAPDAPPAGETPAPGAVAPAPAADGVFFVEPADGATVTSPVHVVFGVRGMEVEPAGEVHEGKGHHHLLIDAQTYEEIGTVVPADIQHVHFGKGQTETTLDLPPGEHQLALQFADGAHQSYGEAWSAVIHVTVAPAPEGAGGE